MSKVRKPLLISVVDRTQAVSTLASQTALLIGAARVYERDVRIASIDYWIKAKGFTADEAQNLLWGLADASMAVSEIAAAITSGEATYRGDVPAAEIARRPFRLMGFVCDPRGNPGSRGASSGHDRINLTFAEDVGYAAFVFNMDGSAMTTGATVDLIVKEYAIEL